MPHGDTRLGGGAPTMSRSTLPSPRLAPSRYPASETSWQNTICRCRAHQLSPDPTGRPQNMPWRSGRGSPSIHRHPRKSASVIVSINPSFAAAMSSCRGKAPVTTVIAISALCSSPESRYPAWPRWFGEITVGLRGDEFAVRCRSSAYRRMVLIGVAARPSRSGGSATEAKIGRFCGGGPVPYPSRRRHRRPWPGGENRANRG